MIWWKNLQAVDKVQANIACIRPSHVFSAAAHSSCASRLSVQANIALIHRLVHDCEDIFERECDSWLSGSLIMKHEEGGSADQGIASHSKQTGASKGSHADGSLNG